MLFTSSDILSIRSSNDLIIRLTDVLLIRSCAAGGGGNGGNETTLRSSSAGGDPCYGKSMSSSICLPDGYRTFGVWIYCDYNGFKLISMILLQYCSCKRYNWCGYWVPQISTKKNILLCNKTLKEREREKERVRKGERERKRKKFFQTLDLASAFPFLSISHFLCEK